MNPNVELLFLVLDTEPCYPSYFEDGCIGGSGKDTVALSVSKWGCRYVVTMEKMCHKCSFNEGTQLCKLVTKLLKLCQIAVLLHSFFNEFLEKRISLPLHNIAKNNNHYVFT